MDDPRNTDNAWMETVAVNFHDESGSHCLFFFFTLYTHTLVLKPLSLLSPPNLLFCPTMTRCYHRQQCERTAAASWRWRRTSPVGWRWLEPAALCESFQLPGAGCQREKSPLVIKDEGERKRWKKQSWEVNVKPKLIMLCQCQCYDSPVHYLRC